MASALATHFQADMTLYHSTPDVAVPIALLGEDYPGLRAHLAVREGDTVAVGQTVFRDAKRPEITFASPITGRVTEIRLGARRMFAAMVIVPVDGGPTPPTDGLTDDADLRAYLLRRGAWPAFIARPFGGPPAPDARPDAIIVSAMSSSPKGTPPREVLVGREAEFARGLTALDRLTDGTIHLCVEHGAILSNPDMMRLRVHSRRATKAWRMASHQTAKVHPTGANDQVWTIGYQDVLAIGHLLETGRYDPIRCITVRHPGTRKTATMRVALGAQIQPLLDQTTEPEPDFQPQSGTKRHGRRATYMGRFHDTVGALPMGPPLARRTPQPVVPFAFLNHVLPARVPAVPLMRALSIGDVPTCEKLGCLELLEEDVAPLSAMCASGTDYGRRLRDVLDKLRKDAA